MSQQEKCSQLEQRALSLGELGEWEEHASGCEDCMGRIRILKMLDEDSRELDLRLDRKGIAELEKALAQRPDSGKLMFLRLSYALQFMAIIAAIILVIHFSSRAPAVEKTHSTDKNILAWDMKVSSQDIGRRISNALKTRHPVTKNLNPVNKATNSLKRKVIELRKNMEKV
ncbi:MAG: hypothetical protein WAX69_20840 [Victivallales bacterium]